MMHTVQKLQFFKPNKICKHIKCKFACFRYFNPTPNSADFDICYDCADTIASTKQCSHPGNT